MALATGLTIAAAVAGASAITKGAMGIAQTAKANRALENFKRQDLRNITEGMRVSTLGAQLNTREAQRRFATSVDALRSGGVRGVVGGLGAQEQLMQNQQARISAELDRQQVMIDRMRAQDEARIRNMQEQRESFDQQMLYGQKAAGRQATMSAIGDLAGAASFAAMNATFGDEPSAASMMGGTQATLPLLMGGGTQYGVGSYGQNPPNMFDQYVNTADEIVRNIQQGEI